MNQHPDPPAGWAELQVRMSRAKTAKEIDEIVAEMKQVLNSYETQKGSGRLQKTSPVPSQEIKVEQKHES